MQNPRQTFFQPIGDHATGRWHGAHEVVKLPLDRRQVVKDVGVVKLQVVEHGGAGPVVHKLAALVEEGGVVFVCLDHKQGRSTERGGGWRGTLRCT
ncbi:hypothetical protein D3C72_2112910 [compost metagenome]